MWTRSELKSKAKVALHANYWLNVGVIFLFVLISGVISGVGTKLGTVAAGVTVIVSFFLTIPLCVSQARFVLNSIDGKGDAGDIGFCFSSSYLNIVIVEFLTQLFIFLWTLLLIVPGIIKSYEYRMVTYILAENPDINYKDALDQSKAMMDGHKMDTFVLDLSFIGWALLSTITMGIVGIFYVNPYVALTGGELYLTLKGLKASDNTASNETTDTASDDSNNGTTL